MTRYPRSDQWDPAGAVEQTLLVRLSGLYGVQVPSPAQTLSRDHDMSARNSLHCRQVQKQHI